MRGIKYADEKRRALRRQVIADLRRVQARIELGADDCGLDSGWLHRVYLTLNALILAGKGAKALAAPEKVPLSVYRLGGRS